MLLFLSGFLLYWASTLSAGPSSCSRGWKDRVALEKTGENKASIAQWDDDSINSCHLLLHVVSPYRPRVLICYFGTFVFSPPAGMSVTSGKYFGSKVSYAAGAPRSNGTGQVVIFTKVKKAESQLRVQLVLSGEQFASSYGYQIATADLNGDR